MNQLGEILEIERENQGISQAVLYEGICDGAEYNRLINGTRVFDRSEFEALLERLGRSSDAFDSLLSDEEYEILELHDQIESLIFRKEIDQAQSLLLVLPKKNKLEEQYAQMIEGILLFYVGKEKDAINIWNKALQLTVNNKRYTVREIKLIVLIELCKEENISAIEKLEKLYSYATVTCVDPKTKIKIMPAIALCLGNAYIAEKKWAEAMEVIKDTLDVLCMVNDLTGFLGLCHQLEIVSNEMGDKEKSAFARECVERISNIYEFMNEPKLDMVSEILSSSIRTQYYLISEYLHDNRVSRNMKKEIMEPYISNKQIQRIECGHGRATNCTLIKLNELFQQERHRITPEIETVRFDELKLIDECDFLLAQERYEEAENVLLMIQKEKRLKKRFLQSIKFRELLIKNGKRMINSNERIYLAEQLLKMTQPYNGIDSIENLSLNRVESDILCQIAYAYKKDGEVEKAVEIWEKVIIHYGKSKVQRKFCAAQQILCYHNLAIQYKKYEEWETALVCAKNGLQLCMETKNMGMFCNLMIQYLESLEGKQEGKNPLVPSEILQLYHHTNHMAKIYGFSGVEERIKKKLDSFL